MKNKFKVTVNKIANVVNSDDFFEKLLITAIMLCIVGVVILVSVNFLLGRPLLDAQIIYYFLIAVLIYICLLSLATESLSKLLKSRSFLEFFMPEKRDEERKGLNISFPSLGNLASETGFIISITLLVLHLFWGEIHLNSPAWGAFIFFFMLTILLVLTRHIVKNLGAARYGVKVKRKSTEYYMILIFMLKIITYFGVSFACSLIPLALYITN